ncbi:acyltransferase family protein [Agromyces archimandritae]|uniref:Acyltransferase n=1 Tax=Agromyces archimandritae TaxID=2781962 RepID=A0A975FNU4_9MICO|nr:acyltransferase family protein [Agromyces archimandritae]QTX05292.1 acyltransferase [Agromyces archimandritae]
MPVPPNATHPVQNRRPIGEIEGLRGLALTLVALFHLFGNGRVSGGVDVFLFVSGFLLTLSLARRAVSGAPAALAQRYGRTLLRLTPAALVVLIATAIMVVTVLPKSGWEQSGREIIASALYFENWELISSQLAYGAAGPMTSPLQHFWSLSIQGQFFLVWPLLITGLVLLARRVRRDPLTAVAILTGIATAASFAYAWTLNAYAPDIAYFDSFARFWELGAGALLALAMGRLPHASALMRSVLGWAGLALIVASGFVVDGATSFPGPLALLPVAGAALVIVASGSPTRLGADRFLALRPMRFVARISYPLYLWHWPILIGYLAIRGYERVGLLGGAAVFALSVAVAWATQRFVVEPILDRRGSISVRRALIAPITAIAVIAAVTAGGVAGVQHQTARQQAAVDALAASNPECLGAAAMDPATRPCDNPSLAGKLFPAPNAISTESDNRPECWAGETSHEFNVCTVGPESGYERHVLAVGDSHNNTFVGAYERIAEQMNWRIDIAGHAFCYWTAAEQPVQSPAGAAACASWKSALEEHIAQSTEVDAYIVTHSRYSAVTVPEGEDRHEVVVEGMVEAWSGRPDPAAPIIAIIDNPRYPNDTSACVEQWGLDAISECPVVPRSVGLRIDDGQRDAAARSANAHVIDLTDFYCTETECPPVIGNAVVAGGWSHLTGTFAKTLAPYIAEQAAAILDR